MNCPPLERNSRGDTVPSWRYRVAPDERDELGRSLVEGNPSIGVAIPLKDDSPRRPAQPRRVLDQRVQHQLQIECRATDYLQHFGSRRLPLQGRGEVTVACLQLLEQADVLDGNDGLIGEGLQQLDMGVR